MTHWKRYVDDTIAVIKLTSTENVPPTLNNFLITFTYKLEQKRKIKFLDVFLIIYKYIYYIYYIYIYIYFQDNDTQLKKDSF